MYFSIAFAFACVGIISLLTPRAGTVLFLATLLIIPSSTAFDSWDYQFGLYGYDYYFLALLCTYPYRAILRRQPSELVRLFALLALLIATSAIGLVAADRPLDKYALRDLRPFLLVAEGLIWLFFVQGSRVVFSDRSALWLGLGAAASCFFGFGLIHFGVYQVTDIFYEENSFRYLAIGSYVSTGALIWLSGNARRIFRDAPLLVTITAAASIAAIVLSGIRTLVIATIVGCAVGGRLRPARVLITAVIGSLLVAAFAYVSVSLGVERVTQAASAEGISAQLATRFGPALETMRGMHWWQWLVGTGMGTTFDIPWFEYRGLDTQNNFVDSTYVTFAIKLGASALIYVFLFGRSLGLRLLPHETARAFALCLAVLGLTMAIPYQKFGIGFPVLCVFVARISYAPRVSSGPGTAHGEANAAGQVT